MRLSRKMSDSLHCARRAGSKIRVQRFNWLPLGPPHVENQFFPCFATFATSREISAFSARSVQSADEFLPSSASPREIENYKTNPTIEQGQVRMPNPRNPKE